MYYSIKAVINQCGALYIINSARNCISSKRSFVYHQADSFLCTPKGVMRYNTALPCWWYTRILRDDIPSLSAWIKKERSNRFVLFWRRLQCASRLFFSRLDTLGSDCLRFVWHRLRKRLLIVFSALTHLWTAASRSVQSGGGFRKKKSNPFGLLFSFWRRHPDLNWGITVLQTVALPLGYDAILLLHLTAYVLYQALNLLSSLFLLFIYF